VLSVSAKVALSLLAPMFFFLAFQTLAEIAVPGSLPVVVDGLERALAPVAALPLHGAQGPDKLAGGGVSGVVEGFGVAAISADVSTGSRKAKVGI
jgi:hypothetical protein